jgi:DNA mismatch repair protein MutS2
MLYPENIEQKLGFDKIRTLLRDYCTSPLGVAFVEKMRFSDHFDHTQKMIRQVAEMLDIVRFEAGNFPNQNYLDATPQLAKAAIEGAFLQEEELFDLKLSIRTVQDCLRFFDKKEPELYPALRELLQSAFEGKSAESPADGTVALKSIALALEQLIDERGRLKDSASPELQAIRRQLIAEENSLRKKLETLLKMAKSQGWIGDDTSLTIRNGRMVIPLLAEHKRKIRGFVHDESDTGKTVFLEPAEILDANNALKELEARERREIVRILTQVTQLIRPHVPVLRRAYTFLGIIDFVRAKARLAVSLEAVAPLADPDTLLDWHLARHPLLDLSFRKQGKKVVPLRIALDSQERILLISGPNAGGKSVTLKTVGLIQYMYQCGLLVPMAEHSKMGFFKHLFIDIGDEQSLENDLSTYSSHLTNMRHFLLHANKKTLFLIDEFGTGTEPSLGGAIAESILEELNRSRALGVINTHYTNLKTLASRTDGLLNGAMRYDAEHLEPRYELDMGKPGSSFAVEIAQKIGLPKAIVDRAKQKVGTQQVSFEKLVKELEIEKKVFSEKNIENATRQRKLDQLLSQNEALQRYLDTEKKQILNKAKTEARQLVKEANQRIEQTIREIREQGAEKLATKDIRKELEVFEQKQLQLDTLPETEAELPDEIVAVGGEIEMGCWVRIKGQETIGEVLMLRGKEAEVAVGDLKMMLKVNRLERISRKEAKKTSSPKPKLSGIDLNEKMSHFSFNLDVRGKRGEEALVDVDNFMNDGIMLGYPELRIVHGKGDGILRSLIRNHLRAYKQVSRTADEHPDRGGAGVTIVSMKD